MQKSGVALRLWTEIGLSACNCLGYTFIYGVSIRQAIGQQRVQILLKINRALDLATAIDPTGKLKKQLGHLYWYTITLPESRLEAGDFDGFRDALKSAGEIRREIEATLDTFK